MLGQVGKSDHVARLVIVRPLVRHPNFHLADRDRRRDRVQVLHRLVVTVAEIVRQEEVAVLVILVDRQLERLRLHAPFRADRFRFRFLLCKQRIHPQLPELEVRLHSEQGGPAVDQRVAGRHTDVTGFERLDDLVFLTRIG